MNRRKNRFSNSGQQAFPATGQSGFPLNALLARYTLNLLPHSPLHSEFLEMVFTFCGISSAASAITDSFTKVLSSDEVDELFAAGDSDDLLRLLQPLLERNGTVCAEKSLRGRLALAVQSELLPLPAPRSGYARRADHLMNLLGLSVDELRILECAVCYQARSMFESYCDQYPASDWVPLIAVALDLPKETVRRSIVKGGSLESKGLLEMRKNNLEATAAVFDFLFGLSADFLGADEFALAGRSSFPLESFPVSVKDQRILVQTLRNPAPCHLFFYGRPGTGKTELAKALAGEAGLQAFLVKYGDDGDERDRRVAITATMAVAPSGSMVIIDEADRLLNTATIFQTKQVDKGWINHFMDECNHKVIWITNESGGIETSVLRRFSFSLEFKKFTAAQRVSAWQMQLKGHPLSKVIRPAMVSRLAREYETDAGGIASSLKAVDNMYAGGAPDPQAVEETLGQLLAHHEKLSGIESKKKKLNRLSPNYDVSALNIDFPSAELVSSLKARQCNVENGHRPFSANILFWGLPGTGKTEFAKYIAQELGKELLIKRMSDLQSMWVGQTEKQIAAAFDEADREGAVLFLDEADSLILDRKTASRSWESSQTNEVLTQMENFSGICICCTNLLDGLDEAALRRFTWKLKFLPLTKEGRERLFRSYFQPKGRISGQVKEALRGIHNLTPGDFKTVHQREEYSGGKRPAIELVAALRQECSYKRAGASAPIGFAGS